MADSLGSETNESKTGGRQALLYCKTSDGRAAGMPVRPVIDLERPVIVLVGWSDVGLETVYTSNYLRDRMICT